MRVFLLDAVPGLNLSWERQPFPFLRAHTRFQTSSPFHTDARFCQSVGVTFFSLPPALLRNWDMLLFCHRSSSKVGWTGQICASKGENKSAQHGKMKQGCKQILFAVAVQTTACSHCRINSQSFQLRLRMQYWTALGGKISTAMGFLLSWIRWDRCGYQSGSFSQFLSSAAPRCAHVYLTSGYQSTTFPACGVFARSHFLSVTFGAKWWRTSRPARIIVLGMLPVTCACIISLRPSDSTVRRGKMMSGERTGSRCTERDEGDVQIRVTFLGIQREE